jgi:hypothetical protein
MPMPLWVVCHEHRQPAQRSEAVTGGRGERKQTACEASRADEMPATCAHPGEPDTGPSFRISALDVLIPTEWYPPCRRTKREKLTGDDWQKAQAAPTARLNVPMRWEARQPRRNVEVGRGARAADHRHWIAPKGSVGLAARLANSSDTSRSQRWISGRLPSTPRGDRSPRGRHPRCRR